MNTNLKQSMKPVASFIFENLVEDYQTLCLFPGHYDTTEVVKGTDSFVLAYSNPKGINEAGYHCDQVADDYNADMPNVSKDTEGNYRVKITSKSNRTRYRDFLNFIKYSGLRVTKMRITDMLENSEHEIFNQELEISASAIGQKAGSDFVQLSAHVDPSNFIQRFIDVDLSEHNLLLDETTLAFLRIPGNSKFQVDFTLG